MDLITLLVAVLLFCLVIWAVRAIISVSNLGQPLSTYLFVIVVVVAVLLAIGMVTGSVSLGSLRLRG